MGVVDRKEVGVLACWTVKMKREVGGDGLARTPGSSEVFEVGRLMGDVGGFVIIVVLIRGGGSTSARCHFAWFMVG